MENDLPYRAITLPPRLRLSDSIAAQIEEFIVEGKLRPGQTLPPERLLAQQFGVSRPSLREALLKLEARGLLRVERSGGFSVTDVTAPTMTDPLVHLLRRHPNAQQDVLEMRRGLEMVAAYFAASRATKDDRVRLRRAFDQMIRTRAKGDILADADADAAFHLTVAEASHNVALIHVMRGIYNLMRTSMHHAWEVLYEDADSVRLLHGQHRAMLGAIIAGDPDRAREAAHLHLSFVRESLQQSTARPSANTPGKRGKSAASRVASKAKGAEAGNAVNSRVRKSAKRQYR